MTPLFTMDKSNAYTSNSETMTMYRQSNVTIRDNDAIIVTDNGWHGFVASYKITCSHSQVCMTGRVK